MKQSIYKSYDELPIMLNANHVKNVLGISISSAYELMRENDFPSVKIGNRLRKLIRGGVSLFRCQNLVRSRQRKKSLETV